MKTRPVKFLTAAIMALALAGCGESKIDHDKAIASADSADANQRVAQLSQALTAATNETNPWAAFKAIEHAKARACGDDIACIQYPNWKDVMKAQRGYLRDAIAAGDQHAMIFLFKQQDKTELSSEASFTNLSDALTDKLLEWADKSTAATPNEVSLLYEAAERASNGKVVVRDTSRAVLYLAKIWSSGDKNAAGKASQLYYQINDFRNSYLWSLRCTAPCSRSGSVDLSSLEVHLSPEAAKQAQKAALDSSIIDLQNGGS